MMATGSDISRAGWLFRQSSVRRRWKKEWFVVYNDGILKYFESPNSAKAEERIAVRNWVTKIRTGPECRKADPPEDYAANSENCFIELLMQNNSSMLLCAESLDDMRAWQSALEEARKKQVPAAPFPSNTGIYVTHANHYANPNTAPAYSAQQGNANYPGQITYNVTTYTVPQGNVNYQGQTANNPPAYTAPQGNLSYQGQTAYNPPAYTAPQGNLSYQGQTANNPPAYTALQGNVSYPGQTTAYNNPPAYPAPQGNVSYPGQTTAYNNPPAYPAQQGNVYPGQATVFPPGTGSNTTIMFVPAQPQVVPVAKPARRRGFFSFGGGGGDGGDGGGGGE